MILAHLWIGLMIMSMLVTLVACLRIPAPRPLLFKLLLANTVLALLLECTGRITADLHVNNTILYNAFAVVEFALVLAMVASIRVLRKAWLWGGACIGLAAMAYDASATRGAKFILTEGVLVLSLVVVVMVLVLLWQLARTSTRALQLLPEFWLFMGLLLFYGGLIPAFAMIHFVFRNDQGMANLLWSIPPILSTARYLLAAYACVRIARDIRQGSHG